jgi:hypothetical protein
MLAERMIMETPAKQAPTASSEIVMLIRKLRVFLLLLQRRLLALQPASFAVAWFRITLDYYPPCRHNRSDVNFY